ncbi:MAG: AI-2E family transporter [Rickettsiaceae bacterium]|nr:AI-2E family transporter [Rickettsiaceae bacterium]
MSTILIPWLLILSSTIMLIYMVSDVVLPFIIAFIIAYMLYPATKFTSQKLDISLPKAGVMIFAIFMSIFATLVTIIVPLMYHQISSFIKNLPYYQTKLQYGITNLLGKLDQINPNISNKISAYLHDIIDNFVTLFSSFVNHIWDYTLATINFFTICVIVPFALFYFLKDWGKITHSLESILPVKRKGKMQEITSSINQLLSNYIRGQLTICTILSIYYVIGFSLIRLDFALLLGLCSGFLILIPFIGTIIACIITLFSSYIAFGLDFHILYILILYSIAHFVEGYYLTPKIIGAKIGLHPVWIIFAVLVAANLFGILGIVIALPVAGIIKILWMHLLDYYKSSEIYNN